MGWAERNPSLRKASEVNRALARIQLLMTGVSSEYQLDAMLRREVQDEVTRDAVRKILLPFLKITQ